MTCTVTAARIRLIRPGEQHFRIDNGFAVANRAGVEISNNCPAEYKSILLQALSAGWIKPVAHVTEEEYMMMQLSN
jgi:hypothetical protein